MAFTTSQTLDTAMLQNLLFRNSANAPISSMYTLYANGRGQTFWDKSVRPEDISTLSTALYSEVYPLSTSIGLLSTNLSTLSSYTSGLFNEYQSTTAGQIVSTGLAVQNVQDNFLVFSNVQTNNFNTLSNTLTTQVNDIYNSSLVIVQSTIAAVSSISTFTNEIAAVQNSVNASASSFSTQLALTTDTLNSNIVSSAINTYTTSVSDSKDYTDQEISTVYGSLATNTALDLFSTTINQAVISSSSALATALSTSCLSLDADLSSFKQSTFSTQIWAISTINGINIGITELQTASTTYISTTNALISTYTSPLFQQQDTKFSLYTSTIFNNFSSISSIATNSITIAQTVSTSTGNSIRILSTQTSTIASQVISLTREFSTLTTSSILAGVYSTFIQLEDYAVELINSTINTVDEFKSTLFYSTTVQNTSTATGFFSEFVSTTYDSTVSTVVPITIDLTSSIISSLYSTGSYFLTSSLISTAAGQSVSYVSTVSSYTNDILISSATQINSSILGYLSTPAGQQLAQFSTIGSQTISTFNGQAVSTFNRQSTIFFSTYNTNSTLFATLNSNTSSILSTLTSSFVIYNSTFNGLVNRFNTQSISSFTAYGVQFNSTLVSYSAQNQSTTTGITNATASSAGNTLIGIQNSTMSTYNYFASSMLQQASTIAFSSLYMSQSITLTNNNFEGSMDFYNYRNFNVNIRGPLVNGSSNYRVGYLSNSLTGLDYRQGIITVDVSTIGASYTNNNGQLCFDVYRWGLPTTIFNSVYPTISNADYTALYTYTINSNTVFTSLLNVYPRLRIQSLGVSPAAQLNVFSNNVAINTHFWRGSPVTINWSNYSHFPFGAIGAPPYNPEILVDVFYNDTFQSRNGPYQINTSTVTVTLPSVTGTITNPISAKLRTYFVGKPMDAAELNLNVLMPQMDFIRVTPASGKFLLMEEIQAFVDSGTNILPTVAASNINLLGSGLSGTATNQFFSSFSQYGKASATDGNTNTLMIGGVYSNNPDPNATLQIATGLQTPKTNLSRITIRNVPTSCNITRGGVDFDYLEMNGAKIITGFIMSGVEYTSSITLSSAASQTYRF